VALHPLKSNDGADQIELTLVAAVATVLVIRGYLQLTGYPKVGNGELHIAHLLYGGLFMLLAIFLLLVLLNTGARWYAALLGGIGFGFFIDEIGKFISKDVNYFFKPAVAVMYAVFMVLFLALGALRRWRVATRPRDAKANALTLLAGAAGQPLDVTTRTTVAALLEGADANDPVVQGLREGLAKETGDVRYQAPAYARVRDRLESRYRRFILKRRSQAIIAWVGVIYLLSRLPVTIEVQVKDEGLDGRVESANAAHAIQFTAALVSAAFIIIGLLVMRRSRLEAYRWFLRAVLISLLITQLFVFYHDQFTALTGLAIDLLFYFALRYMIRREEDPAFMVQSEEPDPPSGAKPAAPHAATG
jgi:hypothetical protein